MIEISPDLIPDELAIALSAAAGAMACLAFQAARRAITLARRPPPPKLEWLRGNSWLAFVNDAVGWVAARPPAPTADPLFNLWLATRLDLSDPCAVTSEQALYADYCAETRRPGESRLDPAAFSAALTAAGAAPADVAPNGHRLRAGLRLLPSGFFHRILAIRPASKAVAVDPREETAFERIGVDADTFLPLSWTDPAAGSLIQFLRSVRS